MKSKKIRKALDNIRSTRSEVNKFIQTEPLDPTKYFDGKDVVEMSLAFDNEKIALINYELALAEEYPNHYTEEAIKSLESKRAVLEKRVKLLKIGKFPPVE